MAFPAWASAAITGASGLAGPLISGHLNAKQQEHAFNKNMHAWRMENQQREHEWYRDNEYAERLWGMQNRYNESMWHMMNDYNSPAAQMARYSQAGLNPNLIYGNSNTTSPVSSASFNQKPFGNVPGVGDFRASSFNLGDLGGSAFTNAYMQALTTSVQLDNIKAQTDLTNQQSAKVAAETQGVGTQNAISQENLNNIKEWAGKQLQATFSKTNAETSSIIDANSRANEMQDVNVALLSEQLKKVKGENVNIDQRVQLEQQEMALKMVGIYPGDSKWFKIMGALLQKLGLLDKAEDIIDLIK